MDLEELRQLNHELLQKLKTNQEEFRKRMQTQSASPSSYPEKTTQQGCRGPEAKNGKENRNQVPKDGSRAPTSRSEPRSRSGLRFPSKSTPSCGKRQSDVPRVGRSNPSPSNADVIYVPSAEGLREDRPGKSSESGKTRVVPGNESPKAGEKPDDTRADGGGRANASVRMPPGPKSILLTPRSEEAKEKSKKETGHVTFNSHAEEYTIPAADWSVRPYLGYDWIAGLLDVDSSLSDKPEEYFAELQDFRQVNREDCIHNQDPELDGLCPSATDSEVEPDPVSHQCVFCYRLNKRLFAKPLNPESACPVCKTPRARRPPETLVEPAFVRVSIPWSTLLPAYKHKIHRRKSYEAADNLALPSHCQAGWENPVRASSPAVSSLDLRSTVKVQPSHRSDQLSRFGKMRFKPGFFRVPRAKLAAVILSLPWLVDYASLEQNAEEEHVHWNSWQPWICMCDLHKQARIRHFVVWDTNLTLNVKTSEFWQEKPCASDECDQCLPQECPEVGKSDEDASFIRRFQRLSPSRPHDVEIPLPAHVDFPAYDSLPVVDDVGDD